MVDYFVLLKMSDFLWLSYATPIQHVQVLVSPTSWLYAYLVLLYEHVDGVRVPHGWLVLRQAGLRLAQPFQEGADGVRHPS